MAANGLLKEDEVKTLLREYTRGLPPDKLLKVGVLIQNQTNKDALVADLQRLEPPFIIPTEKKLPQKLLQYFQNNIEPVIQQRIASKNLLSQEEKRTIRRTLTAFKAFILNYVSIVSGILQHGIGPPENEATSKRLPISDLREKYILMNEWNSKKLQYETEVKEMQEGNNILIFEFCQQLIEKLKTIWKADVEQKHIAVKGKHILQLKKPVLLLSDHINAIEESIKASRHGNKISDVHFVASEVFFIDRSLDKKIWHGINVFVFAKKVTCMPIQSTHLTWDLSGLDGEDQCFNQSENLRNTLCSGKLDGRHGMPGSHGGNVVFLTQKHPIDMMPSFQRLIVKSNGGRGEDGANGQHGKDGINGADGQQLSLHSLKERFESFIGIDPVRKVSIKNLAAMIAQVIFSYPFKITEPTGNNNYRNGRLNVDSLVQMPNYYIFARTEGGLQIECGFRKEEGWMSDGKHKEAYILVKGQPGQKGTKGTPGGKGGAGGPGGFHGTILTLEFQDRKLEFKKTDTKFQTEQQDGENGESGNDGKWGKNGEDGKPGKDVGVVEGFGVAGGRKEYKPGYYKLATYDIKPNNESVFSEYHKMYVKIEKDSRAPDNNVQGEEPIVEKNDIENEKDGMLAQTEQEPQNPQIEVDVEAKRYEDYVLPDSLLDIIEESDLSWWQAKFDSVIHKEQIY